MTDATIGHISLSPGPAGVPGPHRPNLDTSSGPLTKIIFGVLLLGGLLFTGYSLWHDIGSTGAPVAGSALLLLAVALVIALGFEFVNGFHDTANAVATVIYTHSLPAPIAVVWSGFFNFLGVLLSSGLVAFGIISLLPVELILQVGSGAGFAMVFALLIAAIIWNLGTWMLGLPASSSHTLIGSIIGVGVANSLLNGGSGTSGVDWTKAKEIGLSLLISPVVGFVCAAALLLVMKALIRNRTLYEEPRADAPPPLWIRALLILTCTGVSFAHGSNDGQKGMGLIMLILIGTVPTAYALNRTPEPARVASFVQVSDQAANVITAHATGAAPGTVAPTTTPAAPAAEPPAAAPALPDANAAPVARTADERAVVTTFVETRKLGPDTIPALGQLITDIKGQVQAAGSVAEVPLDQVKNVRNDMYLASEAIRFALKQSDLKLTGDEVKALTAYRGELDYATKFIPFWVKVAVAIALGLGTMIGWKRIVITVGEKIGKTHLTYAQGASAELVAAATIAAADMYGLPVSTTHVLSSGVAGTMAANGSGLQMSTVRNLLMAWVLTLPCAIIISGVLYTLFHAIF